ncbi:MAG: fimbrillin family protein [Bacteroidaceae bacterium]|nr:fimbrillin family protein [Bacteroidaceae bacterium]
MKKSLLILMAAAAIVACSKNDTVKELENETVLIGFETYHANSTRAAVTAPSGLTSANGGFGVYGFKHANNVEASNHVINLSSTSSNASDAVKIFDNVKVWYESSSTQTQGFTYEVPKYWDVQKYYTFFAYAPYTNVASGSTTGISFDQATGKFTRNDIIALQSANATTPGTVSVSVGYESAQSRTQYGTADESGIIDYLIATYVPGQKKGATNQQNSSATYDPTTGKDVTVGFTFYHILSKLNILVQAKDETGASGHGYSGVKSIKVTSLNITNLPAASDVATYAQTGPETSEGTFTSAAYASTLTLIGTGGLSTSELYILDGGNMANSTITNPASYIPQNFHYYVAPNTPATAHILNIDYTITYVDGIIEPYTRSIDLSQAANLQSGSATFSTMAQNNVYNLTVTIGLNQIYFTVDEVEEWADPENDTNVPVE